MSLEAAVAWEVCASIHQTYAKGKDALFTTRQADFIKHANDARMKAGWQGLTERDVQTITENAPSVEWAVLMTESTLKEKNASC